MQFVMQFDVGVCVCAVTDDSEEWTGEDDENFSPTHETVNPVAPM